MMLADAFASNCFMFMCYLGLTLGLGYAKQLNYTRRAFVIIMQNEQSTVLDPCVAKIRKLSLIDNYF